MENVYASISWLVEYGVKNGMLEPEDKIYATNLLLDVLKLDERQDAEPLTEASLETVLATLLDDATERGLIEQGSIVARDLFDTRLMNCLMPRPSQVIHTFWEKYKNSPQEATDYYYKLSCDSDYIRRYRIVKDKKWTVDTDYGVMDVTINLSKPEKDPKAIAAALKSKKSGYPKCLLCKENEGYAGRLAHPARENHRINPVNINNTPWFFQYSPYVYYNEHCIVFNSEHTPMKIERATFRKLFDFVKIFPHYFVGSNADLPIVGGSILTHDHFQGGHYTFAMAKAPIDRAVSIPGYEDIEAGIVKWPMSVLRLRGEDTDRLVELSDRVLTAWRGYTDESVCIFAETEGVPHNTITPIVRKRDGKFEIDLVLRNNLTTEEHPLGVYHPHAEYHHIKKENIGLIEVMGLAVLPARLKQELEDLKNAMLAGEDISANETLAKHADWVKKIEAKYDAIHADNIETILEQEVGLVYAAILEQCGVFKRDEAGFAAFERFIASL